MLGAKSQKFKQNEPKGKGKGKEKGKPQKKQVEEDADHSDDYLDAEMDEDDIEFDDDDNNDLLMDLFWKMEIKPGKESVLEEPEAMDSIICVTNACYGTDVNKNSRTVVSCKSVSSEDFIPIFILNQGVNENVRLNLKFSSSATFKVEGTAPSTVYLTGYLEPDTFGDDESPEDLEDIDFEDKFSNKFQPEPAIKKRKLENQKQPPKKENEAKLQVTKKVEVKAEIQKKEAESKEEKSDDTPKLSKSQQKKLKQQKKKEAKKAQAQAQAQAQPQTTNNNTNKSNEESNETKDVSTEKPKDEQKTESNDKGKTPKKDVKLPNGIEYKDLKEGTGDEIQNGQTIALYYVGQLDDKKVFDKVISGDGFEYKVGSDEPIKGWNSGIKGMKVGSKRRIVIPPKFAYGAEGSVAKGVPANSTLTFTIEIKSTK